MDLKELSDDAFSAHERDVKIERERRDNLDHIPGEIAAMAAKFRDGGGDETALADAITSPDDPFDGGLDLYDVDEDTATH